MNARALYPVPGSPPSGVRAIANAIGAPLGVDPCTWGPAVSATIRVLDGVPPIQRGTARVFCPGDEAVLVKAENTSVEIAETIDVVLTSEIKTESFDPASFAWPHIVAHLCWGIGSQTFNAWVDVLQGTHFSVVAELLKVSVKYQYFIPPWAPAPASPPPEFKVAGGLGYGCSKRIQLTQIACIEEPGGKAVLCIPPFAEAFHVMPADGSAMDDLSMRVLPFGGALGVPVPGPKFGELIPIMGGAEFIEVTNEGDGPLLAFLVFILGL